jgi:dephospho-CoA kinase
MLRIGITGGIGSGKSTVSKILQTMGYPVFNSDDQARKILFQSKDLHDKLKENFGEEIIVNGIPDKVSLAKIVFSSKEKLKMLNELIHPLVRISFDEWILKQKSKIVIKEAAILIESGAYKECDKIIVVKSPEELRIKRVMKRDSVTEEEVKRRMKNQLPSNELMKFADFVIENDESHALLPQINLILTELNKSC